MKLGSEKPFKSDFHFDWKLKMKRVFLYEKRFKYSDILYVYNSNTSHFEKALNEL